MKRSILVILCLSMLSGVILFAQEADTKITKWLVLGPLPLNKSEIKGQDDPLPILQFSHLPVSKMNPQVGKKVRWAVDVNKNWRSLKILPVEPKGPQLVYYAIYLKIERWLQTELTYECPFPTAIYLNGKCLKTNLKKDRVSITLNLENKKHLLVIKVFIAKADRNSFSLDAALQNKKGFETATILQEQIPKHRFSIPDLLNGVNIRAVRLSPDGKRAAVFLNQRKVGEDKNNSWLEILNVNNGFKQFTSENFGRISGFNWYNDSNSFSYTKSENEFSSIYKYNLSNNTQKKVLDKIKHFSDYWWSANQQFFIYSTFHKKEKKSNLGYKYIKEISQRSTSTQYQSKLYLYFPGSGATHQISSKKEDLYPVRINSDPDPLKRPYSKSTYFSFNIKRFTKIKLFESYWINNVYWSPDSRKLLVLGGPSTFNGIGKNLPDKVIPNDYDGQAFIYNLATKKIKAISKIFDPSINSAFWHPLDKDIYFTVVDQSFVRVYQYSVKKDSYKKMNTGVDVIGRTSYARRKRKAVYQGSSVSTPSKLYRMNLAANTSSLLKDYNRSIFSGIKFAKVIDWNFKTDKGKTIKGRIHFPPDFNGKKKYPCIVYYYGGTSPVTRDFGGRYPKNWYTAKGYVVYVLQPSGTVGFGQQFSALHVNDWGKITADEIISGVKKLLAAHPFIDPEKVGAIGASYGGFMTMVLGSKTDIFSALISHAGISALSSYWGVGDYGYSYSAVATADSFPWNRKDIYVGHSPLFMAERFSSPLLLLHGDIDNNVPPGESYQMFAALKLLGKEVALVTFKDQQHWILEYNKRIQWMKTIIAWYDKHLKNQPEHWQFMYEK